jgi:hypothetical protein
LETVTSAVPAQSGGNDFVPVADFFYYIIFRGAQILSSRLLPKAGYIFVCFQDGESTRIDENFLPFPIRCKAEDRAGGRTEGIFYNFRERPPKRQGNVHRIFVVGLSETSGERKLSSRE